VSDGRGEIERRIREIEADRAAAKSDATRRLLDDELAKLRARLGGAGRSRRGRGKTGAESGRVDVAGEARVETAVGLIRAETVQMFFGARPPGDAKEMLESYLRSLGAHDRVRLDRLLAHERSGRDDAAAPAMSLRKVFTTLATDARVLVGPFDLTRDAVIKALDAGNPGVVIPEKVRIAAIKPGTARDGDRGAALIPDAATHAIEVKGPIEESWETSRRGAAAAGKSSKLTGAWFRPEIVVEVVAASPRVVLLGSPGSGKSTVLHYLTVTLAEVLRAGKDRVPLPGWEGVERIPVPLYCQLGKIALGDDPESDFSKLLDALLSPVERSGLRSGLREQVLRAWRSGGALLCFDGLDEVSSIVEGTRQGDLSPRERIVRALGHLADEVAPSRIVVTCRTKPYEEDKAWRFGRDWEQREIEPFAFGQVREYLHAWYDETCADRDARYSQAEAAKRAGRLVDLLKGDRRELRELTKSPLLLTMLALLDYHTTELPERRVDVYEELVRLLLDRWDWARSDRTGRPEALGVRLGIPGLKSDDLMEAMYEIAFDAHAQTRDGRGALGKQAVYEKLDPFFEAKLRDLPEYKHERLLEGPARDKSQRFLDMVLVETGLLFPEGKTTYVLPHLTFEEYLAACHLARNEAIDLAYRQWLTAPDRWREVLALFLGRLLNLTKFPAALQWLELLTAAKAGSEAKTPDQRQQDTLFAAFSYDQNGRGTRWSNLMYVNVREFEGHLRVALADSIEHPAPTTTLARRFEATAEIGKLGDPRFPVEIDGDDRGDEFQTWASTLDVLNRDFGRPNGYWCYVRPGKYRIGGWDKNQRTADPVLPEFWIARLPVTVAQFEPFVGDGYGPKAGQWWTPEGRKWKDANRRSEPYFWGDPRFRQPNQALVGVSWYEAVAWSAWLTEKVRGQLPAGYVIRLPTEAEWEAAAAYDAEWDPAAADILDVRRRPYPWGTEDPTPEHAIYAESEKDRLGQPAPVGVCPAGAAACGALDMAGNVWEWTVSRHSKYPEARLVGEEDFEPGDWSKPATWVALRGGSWWSDGTFVRCGARIRFDPDGRWDGYVGVRVVVAPRLARLF